MLSSNFSMVAMSLIIPLRNNGLIIQSTSHELLGPGWVHHAVMVTSLFKPLLLICKCYQINSVLAVRVPEGFNAYVYLSEGRALWFCTPNRPPPSITNRALRSVPNFLKDSSSSVKGSTQLFHKIFNLHPGPGECRRN